MSSIINILDEFFVESGYKDTLNNTTSEKKLYNFIYSKYDELSEEKKAVINLAYYIHNSGIVLPLLLVNSKITPSEYANSVFIIL